MKSCRSRLGISTYLLTVAALSILLPPRCFSQQDPLPTAPKTVSLELGLGDGRSQFHLGEIIPVNLTFRSSVPVKFSIWSRDCNVRSTYQYHLAPVTFADRATDIDAAMGMEGMTCDGGNFDLELGPKPFEVEAILNSRFRMEVPGKYRISVTSSRLGFAVDSNTVDLEILPADPDWEKAEVRRALSLLKAPAAREQDSGCSILKFLGTEEAEITMAKIFGDGGNVNCDSEFLFALVAARNRKAVLDQLSAGLADPHRPISAGYLRTIAIVSLYQEHPDWYPAQVIATQPEEADLAANPRTSGELWRQGKAIRNREIYYAKMVSDGLREKVPEARAECIVGLLNLGRDFGAVAIPPEIWGAVRDEIPSVLRSLPIWTQTYILGPQWFEVESRAMIPVLDQIIANELDTDLRSVALLRLHELAPEKAEPYIRHELSVSEPRMTARVLGLLPDQEMPELNEIMLRRVQRHAADGYLSTPTAIVQRYASGAIADDLRSVLLDGMGSMDCGSEANLLAYFLRVNPAEGRGMLRQAMLTRGRTGCPGYLLQLMPKIRMSPEVQDAAIVSLDDPDPNVVEQALKLLQSYGSVESKSEIIDHFRKWHDYWRPRLKDLDKPETARWSGTDWNYFAAVAFAQAWLVSKEELKALAELCLTERCKQRASSQIGQWSDTRIFVTVGEPRAEDIDEWVEPGGNMERLKQKLAQYPKGAKFAIDDRSASYNTLQRVYGDLRAWSVEHGYSIEISQVR
jgi:hypothetical protein